jgi:hypothetical protein
LKTCVLRASFGPYATAVIGWPLSTVMLAVMTGFALVGAGGQRLVGADLTVGDVVEVHDDLPALERGQGDVHGLRVGREVADAHPAVAVGGVGGRRAHKGAGEGDPGGGGEGEHRQETAAPGRDGGEGGGGAGGA